MDLLSSRTKLDLFLLEVTLSIILEFPNLPAHVRDVYTELYENVLSEQIRRSKAGDWLCILGLCSWCDF